MGTRDDQEPCELKLVMLRSLLKWLIYFIYVFMHECLGVLFGAGGCVRGCAWLCVLLRVVLGAGVCVCVCVCEFALMHICRCGRGG